MIQVKTPFLIFLVISLFVVASCQQKNKIDTNVNVTIESDSLNYYVQQMKDSTFSDSLSLNFANLAYSHVNTKTTNPKTIEEILKYKVYLFESLKNVDSVLYTCKTLVNSVLKSEDTVTIGAYYAKIGYFYYSSKFQADSAFVYYNKAKEIHQQLNDSLNIGIDLANLAMLQSDFGNYEASDKMAIEAIKYFPKDNVDWLPSVYNCIAINSKKQLDFYEAIYWYDKAIDITDNDFTKTQYIINKAVSYRYLEKYDMSIQLFNEVLQDTLLATNLKVKNRVIDHLAYAKWLQNKNRDVLSDFESALAYRIEINDLWGLNVSYAHLSEYFEEKNPKKALRYAHKMLGIATTLKSPPDQLEALQKIIKLDNSPKVKEYYISYIHISDSINNAEKSAKNKFAKLEYDSEKNREENLQLKIVSSEKELALEKEKTTNIIGIVSSGSIVFALLIFGYFKTQKHQEEKRAEVYKTETRIAKKIHDEVANNVVNIMNKVQYTEESKDKLLDDLEKVYLLTRNISHQNNSIGTGSEFEGSLRALLTSFNTTTTTIILKNSSGSKLEHISKDKQIEIYRVLQELLVNMQKHSNASLVAITFHSDQNKYLIKYSDNGVGVDLNAIAVKNGLQNIESRIKSINGVITFETSLNNGFKTTIRFKGS